MDEGQGTTSQAKGINNSIRGASVNLGIRPETIVAFLPYMREYDAGTGKDIFRRMLDMEQTCQYLYKRIEELSKSTTDHYAEAVRLKQEIERLTKGQVA